MNKSKSKTMMKAASLALGFVFAGSAFGMTAVRAFADDEKFEGITTLVDSSSAEDALEKAKKFNESIAEEGFTLLKNENKALPLGATNMRVNLLGKNWVNPAYGGSGSSSFDANSGSGIDLFEALEYEGFTFNRELKAFYEDNARSGSGRPSYSYGASDMITGETPVASYGEDLISSLDEYGGANIVMLTRVGGEGYEVSSFYGQQQDSSDGSLHDPVIEGRKNPTHEHYLMLDDNEKDLLKLANEHGSKKVILVINAAQPLELHEEDLALCDAILWVGLPGSTGFAALPRILAGSVNPSGRTVDTYAKDFYSIPAFQNFSLNEQNQYMEYDPKNSSWQSSGNVQTPGGNAVLGATGNREGAVVTYEEGIYVGYRYFETRAFEEDKTGTPDAWYQDNVNYPFGYGLSYTTFEYSNVNYKTNTIEKNGTVDVDVTVKNTGSVAGKEVVEFYYSAPYTVNGIEKSHVVLGDFAKTRNLAPGESQTLSLSIRVKDMASYDYNDLNYNGYQTYELDAGDYTFYVGANSHAWYNAPAKNVKTINLAEGFQYEMDIDGKGDKNDNQFDYVSDGLQGNGIETLSRADFEGTMPEHPTVEERTVDAATAAQFQFGVYSDNDPDGSEYDEGQPWYTATMPTQRATELTGDEENIIKLLEMADVDYDDEKWDQFLNQFTVNQLVAFVEQGFFTTQAVEALGIPESKTPDGPFGFVYQANGHSSNRCYYCSPCIVAATFNKEIARQQGETLGEDGAWMGYNGIYAPGANIHRTPFSGRNFEYYSEDATLSATMCREVVAGMQSRGVMPFIKHFALNDQEQDRNGVATFATEQAMREIYLRSFQWAVEDAKALGIMSSFNRVGMKWAGANYELLTNVLRKEWGFKGFVITDWANGGYMNLDQMIRGGGDVSLSNRGQHVTTTEAAMTPTHVAAMRQATKNVCYAVLHTNEMSKLTNYEDVLGLQKEYVIDAESKTTTVEFASKLFEDKYKAEGWNVSYEITKPDAITRSEAEQGHNNAKNPPQLPANNYTFNTETGELVVNANGLKSGKYIMCVSIRLEKAGVVKYLGQEAQTTFSYEGTPIDDYIGGLTATIEDLQAQLDDLLDRYWRLMDRVSMIEAGMGGISGGEDHTAELEALQSNVTALQGTITTLQGTITELQTSLKAAQDKITALEQSQGSGSTTTPGTDHSEEIGKLQDANKQLEDKVKELESKIAELEKNQGSNTGAGSGDSDGGCGGVIGAGSAILAVVTILGGAYLATRKKND